MTAQGFLDGAAFESSKPFYSIKVEKIRRDVSSVFHCEDENILFELGFYKTVTWAIMF